MEAVTDREIMIKLDANVASLRDSIDRFAKALETLEETKVKDLDSRLKIMERFVHEWAGVYKLIAIIGLILGVIVTIKVFIK